MVSLLMYPLGSPAVLTPELSTDPKTQNLTVPLHLPLPLGTEGQ